MSYLANVGKAWEDRFARKPPKISILRGLKLRGLDQNQVIYRPYVIQNDRTAKSSILFNFRDKPPTHMRATHAIINFEKFF